MSRWTLVAPAPAILLAGGCQAHPGELRVVSADDTLLRQSAGSDGSGDSYACTAHTLDVVGNESVAGNVVSLALRVKSGACRGRGGSGSGGGQAGGKGRNK